MVKDKEHYYWLDLVKIVACFLVIVNHTGGFLLTYSGSDNLGSSLFYMINFVVCKIGVPLFIMTTGFLLLEKKSSFSNMGKKIYRIFVPLILLSIFSYFSINGILIEQIKIFIIELLKNPLLVQFWYLYMLIGLYLVTPFLQKMVKNFDLKDYKYFIVIILIIPSFLPIVSSYFNLNFSFYFTIALFPICVGYYIAGLYLSKLPLNKKYRNIAIILAIISWIGFLCSMLIPYMMNGEISYTLDNWSYINVAIPSLSLFYLFRYYFENRKFKEKTNKVIMIVGSVTFGIFLFHTFINYRLYGLDIMQNIFGLNIFVGIIVLEILTFIISGILTYILKKVKLINKFL